MKRRNGETERWGLSPTLMVRRDARRKGALGEGEKRRKHSKEKKG